MEIQLATEESLLDVLYLLFKCVKDMNRKGMFQWNQGIGRKMMDFAIDYAGRNNYPIIRLDVFEANEGANKLYSKLGFSKTGKFCFPFQETEFVCYEMKI